MPAIGGTAMPRIDDTLVCKSVPKVNCCIQTHVTLCSLSPSLSQALDHLTLFGSSSAHRFSALSTCSKLLNSMCCCLGFAACSCDSSSHVRQGSDVAMAYACWSLYSLCLPRQGYMPPRNSVHPCCRDAWRPTMFLTNTVRNSLTRILRSSSVFAELAMIAQEMLYFKCG